MADTSEGPNVATPEDIADLIAQDRDTDVLFVNGAISRQLDAMIAELSRKRRRRLNVLLILVTEGGDADAGYKIARCLQEKYKGFLFLVSGYCKSAGTLVALGANQIIVADNGELGPLDVQMSKPDELMQLQSGLTATAALEALDKSAYSSFERFFLTTIANGGGGISTRTATHIAVQMASALYAPIYGHVDAMHVGEAGRALAIAEKYGERLLRKSQNALPGALGLLTTSYPSHGFVIDRREAKSLFRRVREPDDLEQALIDLLGEHALEPRGGRSPWWHTCLVSAPRFRSQSHQPQPKLHHQQRCLMFRHSQQRLQQKVNEEQEETLRTLQQADQPTSFRLAQEQQVETLEILRRPLPTVVRDVMRRTR